MSDDVKISLAAALGRIVYRPTIWEFLDYNYPDILAQCEEALEQYAEEEEEK